MMKLVGISGSLRQASTNTTLLTAAANLTPGQADLRITNLIAQLPLFSPDHDAEGIAPVIQWADLIRNADGLVISTPEYARGYPGALKNALDWLVQGDAFIAKPFMYLHASERSGPSHESLTVVLETMSGIHIQSADLRVPLLGKSMSEEEVVNTPEYHTAIRRALQTFVASITQQAAEQ